MTRVVGAALVLVAALVQVTWAPRLTVLGAFPNLVLVVFVAIAWTYGQRAALVWACIGGLLLDLTSPGPFGPHALALLAAAYLSGFWARNVDPGSIAQPAIAAAAAMLGLPVPALSVAGQLAGAAALYNAILVVPFVLAMRRAHHEVRA